MPRANCGEAVNSSSPSIPGITRCGTPARSRCGDIAEPVATATSWPAAWRACATGTTIGTR
jgi:hypothetical protein